MSDDEAGSQDSYEARRALRAQDALQQRDDFEDLDAPASPVGEPGEAERARPGEGGKADSKAKKARAKLTYEHLTSTAGIPQVFNTFQDAFRKVRKGKNHVTHDLGCFLDLYERWGTRLYPDYDFDTFIVKVAGLHGKPGGNAVKGASLKGDMRELRNSVVSLALDGMRTQDAAVEPMEVEETAGEGIGEHSGLEGHHFERGAIDESPGMGLHDELEQVHKGSVLEASQLVPPTEQSEAIAKSYLQPPLPGTSRPGNDQDRSEAFHGGNVSGREGGDVDDEDLLALQAQAEHQHDYDRDVPDELDDMMV